MIKILKYTAVIIAFWAGLHTFHIATDVTLEKHEHDARYENINRIKSRVGENKNKQIKNLILALQAHENARWNKRLDSLMAHDCWLSKLVYHLSFGDSERNKTHTEKGCLKIYTTYQKDSLKQYLEISLVYLSKHSQVHSEDFIRTAFDAILMSSLVLETDEYLREAYEKFQGKHGDIDQRLENAYMYTLDLFENNI